MTDHDDGLGQIHLILAYAESILDECGPNYEPPLPPDVLELNPAAYWEFTAYRLAQLIVNASNARSND